MTKLQLQKLACDIAFATAAQGLAAVDIATAAGVKDLNLPDPQYTQFKTDVVYYRNRFTPAAAADAVLAKLAAAKPAATTPAPKA